MSLIVLILTIVLIACSIALILIILFQAGRTANASAVSGSVGNFYNKNKSATRELFMKRLTVIVSIVFIVTIIIVNIVINVIGVA